LEAVLEQERAGWGREDLIAAAQRQVERIRAMEAERDAQVAAAREEADRARVKAEAEAKEAREALAKATKGAKS
jgi:RPA family protein